MSAPEHMAKAIHSTAALVCSIVALAATAAQARAAIQRPHSPNAYAYGGTTQTSGHRSDPTHAESSDPKHSRQMNPFIVARWFSNGPLPRAASFSG